MVKALQKFSRRPGSVGLHGEIYGIRMAAFLFARALYMTAEFYLASNIDGAGAFDDMVFRYRPRGKDIWKTAFIQLKHKLNTGSIQLSTLTKLSGDFSLFKYFSSFCEIKSNASTNNNLKHCGSFADFEFVIYTNDKMKGKSAPKEHECEDVSILSSVENGKGYVTFDETLDKDIFEFFDELPRYRDFIIELDNLLESSTLGEKEINDKIEAFRSSVKIESILESLNFLKLHSKRKEHLAKLKDNLEKCDFKLSKEFLRKVKIFHSQSNARSFQFLIVKELRGACKTSHSVASSSYNMYEAGFSEWCSKTGKVEWLDKHSKIWRKLKTHISTAINEISEPVVQEIVRCDIRFNPQHIQRLSDAIEKNTLLTVISNSNIRILQKLKIYQALETLRYKQSLFIGLSCLKFRINEIINLWPCKWSQVLVIDCDNDGNVAETLINIFKTSVGENNGQNYSEENNVETLVDVLQGYNQKLILIVPIKLTNLTSKIQEVLGYNFEKYEETCEFKDFDEDSQKNLLEKNVDFQGKKIALKELTGTEPPDSIKCFIDSDVISTLLCNEHQLCVGRKLSDHCKYYVPRVLEHHIYLKDDILKHTVEDITFAVSGLPAEQLKNYLPPGQNVYEFVCDERDRSHSFKTLADYSQCSIRDKRKIVNPFHNIGEKTKLEEIRYVDLGELNAERDFEELKALCRSVHWIDIQDGSFLWRGSKGNLDIIHGNIDDTQCEKHDITSVIEHRDRTKLLVAEPGMGKSTFLSKMEQEIKDMNPSTWVLRINLQEHTPALDQMELEQDCTERCKKFLWGAAHLPEQDALPLVERIFLQALEQEGKMVIILDGFDEICPDFSSKIMTLIREIGEKTAAKAWVSSRPNYRKNMEESMMKLALTLKPLTPESQIEFLVEYWRANIESSKRTSLPEFAQKLLNVSSRNFNDVDGEFTGIPLQIMMLGEAFVNEAKEFCLSGEYTLQENLNILALFKKFWEKKCDIYFSEKNGMDSSKPEVKRLKTSYLDKHMFSALKSLFSPKEVEQLLGSNSEGALVQVKEFLTSGSAEKLGVIREDADGIPQFIHRCFAEYFAAKWFADNFMKCENFISSILLNRTYDVTRKIFDRMLAEGSKIHSAILNNNISAIEKILESKTDVNILDRGGRTALHLAAYYNSPITQTLLSIPGINVNVPDAVLKWTPMKYAERAKSWMVMNILLENGGKEDDIVLIKYKIKDQEWGQSALWECARNGYVTLLHFMMNCGIDINAVVNVPKNLQDKYNLLQKASFCGQLEVVRYLLDNGAAVHNPTGSDDAPIQLAASSGNVDIIQLFLEKGMSVNLTGLYDGTPLHCSAKNGKLEATKFLVERGAELNSTSTNGDTPLLLASWKGELNVVRYLTDAGADINIRHADKDTPLHGAAPSGSVENFPFLQPHGLSPNIFVLPRKSKPIAGSEE